MADGALSFFSQLSDRQSMLKHLESRSYLVAAMKPYIPILSHLLGDTERALQILDTLKDGHRGPWDLKIHNIIETMSIGT